MGFKYRRAAVHDMDMLTQTRIRVLRAANRLSDDVDLSEVERQSRAYYRWALQADMHIAYLVFDGERFVGSGGVSFFRVLPTCHIPSGEKAYIMNMYTVPEYRRRGIARHVLDLLVRDSCRRGITAIMLEATAAGRPLYEKYGFVGMRDEMELPLSCLPAQAAEPASLEGLHA